MHHRRPVLLVLLAGSMLLAGCSMVGEPGTTPTANPQDCEPVERDTVDPFRDSVEPSEWPDPPQTRTASSVERYVVDVERAYSRNEALRPDSTRVEVVVTGSTVSKEGDTWVVELTSRTNTWAAGTAMGSATPTVVHGDGPYVPVTYRLTDRALYRIEDSDDGSPTRDKPPATPRGRTLVCFDR